MNGGFHRVIDDLNKAKIFGQCGDVTILDVSDGATFGTGHNWISD